jgi:hypothetical protein
VSILVPAILVIVAGVSFTTTQVSSSQAAGARHTHKHKQQHKQQQQPVPQQQMVNCTLTVPANPLTAQGLATPYQLRGGCDEANKMQAAFVQGAVIDSAGNISIYNPLVVNTGQQPAVAPVVPAIPAGSTVGIWFGFNGTQQANASDNRLLAVALDGALGCTPLLAPDLANPGQMTTALPLNELQAAAQQAAPIALVPLGDPMTLVNNNPNAAKTNLYRMGVDQPSVGVSDGGNTPTYCNNLLNVAPQRLETDAPVTGAANSPDPAAANSLFTFLAQRFQTTFEGPLGTGLQCAVANRGPVQAQKDANGVAISATITVNGQTQCFDNMGTKVAMTVCINNAKAVANANNNNGDGNDTQGTVDGNGNNNTNNGNGDTNAAQVQQVMQVMQCMGQQQTQPQQCTQMMQQQGQMNMQIQPTMQNLLLGLVGLAPLPAMQTQPVQAMVQCFQGAQAQQNVQGQQVMQCIQNNG